MRIYGLFKNDQLLACFPMENTADRIRQKLAAKNPDNHYWIDCTLNLVTENDEASEELTFYSNTMDKRWPAVVLEFLDELSKVYGYMIDEFSMAGMVHQARLERLGKLVDLDKKNTIATREFIQTNKLVMEWADWAVKNREDAHRVYDAMRPTTNNKGNNNE